ncbi:MAG: cadmium-translocating P-type ATPase [Chloroflexi bacterium]|nr:cadmium-translocating P-type ATPase [Chloroflexota bacterium]
MTTASPPVTAAATRHQPPPAGRAWSLAALWERFGIGLSPALCLLGLVLAGAVQSLGWPEPAVLALYIGAYVAGGLLATRTAVRELLRRTINVDLLMVLAALGAASIGYWQEGGILLFLFSLSNALQAYALDRTRRAITALMDLRPDTAVVVDGDRERRLPVEEVAIGQLLLVRPGDRLPLDGVIVSGVTSVDQAPITGESVPVTKVAGDQVFAGTINQEGAITMRVAKLAGESTLARIIGLVVEAQENKAPTERTVERVEQRYAAAVILLTLAAITVPALLGQPWDSSFYRAMTLMVVASPCAIAMAAPSAMLSAIANAARQGILFKGGTHLEAMATLKIVALDKTGTLTTGRLRLTDVVGHDGGDPADVLRLAASLERHSEHPIATALLTAARQQNLDLTEPVDAQAVPGRGLQGLVDGRRLLVGNPAFITEAGLALPPALQTSITRLQAEGKTVMVVAAEQPLGAVAVADTPRATAPAVIARLRRLGIERIIMLTGDHSVVAAALGRGLGVDEVRADLLPEEKQQVIAALMRETGHVAMVGDGVNDAPALATATVGVAMGAAGTDVALETADIVLMADDLTRLPYVIDLSRRTRRTVYQNLAFALGVILVLVVATLMNAMTLPLGVLGHEGSTVLVILNSLRLLVFRDDRASAPERAEQATWAQQTE